MTITNLTRRTALAGAAAGTLIPVAGLANATTSPHSAAEPDPFIDAFWAYVEAEQAYTRSFDDTPEGTPSWEVFLEEQAALVPFQGPFRGFH